MASWSSYVCSETIRSLSYYLQQDTYECLQHLVDITLKKTCSGVKQIPLSEFVSCVPVQVKVWFQNRRTKQKKDQGKDSELRSVVSETAATCSVLRLLEQGRLLTPPGLPGLLPHCGGGALGTALRPPSMAVSNSGSSNSGGTAGGSPPLPAVTSSGTVAGLQSSPAAHGLFSFPMPSILSGVATRISSNPLSMAGSLAGNLQELSARYLSSSAFEPYSRTNGKESTDKKVLEWCCFFIPSPDSRCLILVVFFVVAVSVRHLSMSRSVTADVFLHIWRLERGRRRRPPPAHRTPGLVDGFCTKCCHRTFTTKNWKDSWWCWEWTLCWKKTTRCYHTVQLL